jgi:hypothetical protein
MKSIKKYCKVCGYNWKSCSINPAHCPNKNCNSSLWNKGIFNSRVHESKKYFDKPIRAKYNKNGCLICLSHHRGGKNEYHRITRDGKRWLLHRWVFYIHNGYNPKKVIMHICNNTHCINPSHLKEGSKEDNERHKRNSDRNKLAKLKYSQVNNIKKQLRINIKRGVITKLAKMYHVSPITISSIKHERNWANG